MRRRTQKLLTPREMAALVGIEKSSYMKIENGHFLLTSRMAQRIKRFEPMIFKGIADDEALNPGRKPLYVEVEEPVEMNSR